MTRDAAFFYQILKPGRYLGNELGVPAKCDSAHDRQIVWCYPDRYERAITDPAWRRSYFQLVQAGGLCVSRAVEYGRDVWQTLAGTGRPVFTLDHLDDIHKAAVVVFWAPDVLTAAHIPSIIRRSGLENSNLSIGVLCDGYWIPRFLLGHVDWIVPAPGGWIPRDLIAFLRDGSTLPACAIPARERSSFVSKSDSWRPSPLAPTDPARTPRWVPNVEVEEDYADVDLICVDSDGALRVRDPSAIVLDTLDGLGTTGIDGVRFCDGFADPAEMLVTVLTELQRRYSMKRVRAHCPAVRPERFLHEWHSYRPHLLKPMLRLQISEKLDPRLIIEAANLALNSGWQGLHAVLRFDSFESLSGLLGPVHEAIAGWSRLAHGYADKRPLRLEYQPAPIGQWQDAPDGPDDDSARRYSSELRNFKDDLSRMAAAGTFRVEEVMARNWLAAADLDLWDELASLDLADPNDIEAPAFDWFTWVRQEAGLSEPPKSGYVIARVPELKVESVKASPAQATGSVPLQAPSDNLFGRRRQKSSLSRRLAAPALTRMRVQWAKELSWRLYSHLDLVRAIERAIRRAGLPAAFSEGFHPRLKLSFGPPLAFGLLSDAEYFDLILDDEYQPSHAERLAQSLPSGLPLVGARGMAAGMPALSDTITNAEYSAIIPLDVTSAEQKLDEFDSRPEVSWQRIGREDKRPVDPRPTLRGTRVETTAEGTRWELKVLVGGQGNIRPTEWAMLLFGFTPEHIASIVIRRTALLIQRNATVRTPLDPI